MWQQLRLRRMPIAPARSPVVPRCTLLLHTAGAAEEVDAGAVADSTALVALSPFLR